MSGVNDLQDHPVSWSWEGALIPSTITRAGAGPRALLLPGLSSISTRSEMAPLQALLSAHYETIAADWPGFGTQDKPRILWTPEAMAAWLDHLLAEIAPNPALIVAAGHAAGYVLRHYAGQPEEAPELALIAPTWRGPLPTMMGKRPGWLKRVRGLVDMPFIGQAFYKLNLNDLVIKRMARGHVYSSAEWLTPERMEEKRKVARAGGARFGSIRFVTGALDPFETAAPFRAAAAALPAGNLKLIWGQETPRRSKAEMEALAGAVHAEPTILPKGKLALHEEFPDAVASAIIGAKPIA